MVLDMKSHRKLAEMLVTNDTWCVPLPRQAAAGLTAALDHIDELTARVAELEAFCQEFCWTEEDPNRHESEMTRLTRENAELRAQLANYEAESTAARVLGQHYAEGNSTLFEDYVAGDEPALDIIASQAPWMLPLHPTPEKLAELAEVKGMAK